MPSVIFPQLRTHPPGMEKEKYRSRSLCSVKPWPQAFSSHPMPCIGRGADVGLTLKMGLL